MLNVALKASLVRLIWAAGPRVTRKLCVRQIYRVLNLTGKYATFHLGLGGFMGFSLGPPPCRYPPSLVVSYLGRPVGKAFTTTVGHPGLAGLIHVSDTPNRYIPNNVGEGC